LIDVRGNEMRSSWIFLIFLASLCLTAQAKSPLSCLTGVAADQEISVSWQLSAARRPLWVDMQDQPFELVNLQDSE
jgi:hypothetical protein